VRTAYSTHASLSASRMRLGGIDANGRVAAQVDVGGFLGIGSKLAEIKSTDLKYEQDRNM